MDAWLSRPIQGRRGATRTGSSESDFGCDALATESELVDAAREIGADRMLLLLQRKIPSDDPDLQPSPGNNWRYRQMCTFVLKHAPQLLREDQVPALLLCDQWERESPQHGVTDPLLSPWWLIAASELEPVQSKPRLDAAFDRFGTDTDLAVALWRFFGTNETSRLVNWFYCHTSRDGSADHARTEFLCAVSKARARSPEEVNLASAKGPVDMSDFCSVPETRTADQEHLLTAIVRDSRLSDLTYDSLEMLVQIAHAWSHAPGLDCKAILRKNLDGDARYSGSTQPTDPRAVTAAAEARQLMNEWCVELRSAVASRPAPRLER